MNQTQQTMGNQATILKKCLNVFFWMSFLLYESSNGNQVDGLPLALVGRSEGSATIDENDRTNQTFDENHKNTCP